MSNRILRLSAIAAMLVVTPALGATQNVVYSTTSPVAITSFGVNQSIAGTNNEEPPEFTVSGVELKFVNKGNVAATTVKFVINDGKCSETFVDRGTFNPGAQIKHTFAVEGVVNELPNPKCDITEVDFADGTAWHIARGDVANH